MASESKADFAHICVCFDLWPVVQPDSLLQVHSVSVQHSEYHDDDSC